MCTENKTDDFRNVFSPFRSKFGALKMPGRLPIFVEFDSNPVGQKHKGFYGVNRQILGHLTYIPTFIYQKFKIRKYKDIFGQ